MHPFTQNMRRCKIIGTIGPASRSEKVLIQLVEAGLDICRLNFSHGSHEDHLENIRVIRKVAKMTGKNLSILQDLQGPKIRCGSLMNGGQIELVTNNAYTLTYGDEQTSLSEIPIDYKDLVGDVQLGQRVMMDDGLLIMVIEEITGDRVVVRVQEGGVLKSRKGVNFPDSILSLPILSKKDTKDLVFGINNHVDIIALSFVQTPEDVTSCQKVVSALGADTPVIAKIEKMSAVENIDDIAEVADGIMIARGDLGVEGRIEKVPTFQRKIIASSLKKSKPVIIATQMLESMTSSPRASFAERSDIANGVLEGADCLMLSAEVATGDFPVESVATMDATIREVEKWIESRSESNFLPYPVDRDLAESSVLDRDGIALAACESAEEVAAKVIVCVSLTGSIARAISRWRPKVPVVTLCPRVEVMRRLQLSWGVYGIQNPIFYNTDSLIQSLPELLKGLGLVETGDRIVMTAGIPINHLRSTNMVKINTIL
ncbi:MAG: pyruvate kinase [Proteobacteria bacterium]|nr:pyruvate kinase [Pseudomonadota bacterium]